MFEKKNPLEQEWKQLLKRERALVGKMEKGREPFWEKKLAGVVPDKLQAALEEAFYRGFKVILTGGTGFLEKTFSRERLEAEFKTREYAQKIYRNGRNLRAAKKSANRHTARSVAGAGAEGAVLGLLGIGLPDIPLFLGVVLRSLYTLALHYGIDYEKEEERELLLSIIELSLYRGKDARREDARLNQRLYEMALRDRSSGEERHTAEKSGPGLTKDQDGVREESIRRAAKALSSELLYLKFLQGIPIAGIIGGIYDGVCLKKITRYASVKLERRYLIAKMDD